MKILIVEDTSARQELLCRLFGGHDVRVADSVMAARHAIQEERFDLVFLDYDLQGDGTGADVASLLAGIEVETVVVHSMNPEGVATILQVLPDARVLPIDRLQPGGELYSRLRASLAAHQPVDWPAISDPDR